MSVVEVRDLKVELAGSNPGRDIVDHVSFAIDAGEIVGLVGESGSGKTTIGIALLGHARRGARIVGGQIRVDGTDIVELTPDHLRHIRGKIVAYIPQDPTTSLNPALPLRKQLAEMFEAHASDWSADQREGRIRLVMSEVKLPADADFLRRYPHQLSGGQQQRVAIAMAFILRPKVIVFDEPTTGLDVTTQAHVLNTIRQLCASHGVAGLYITHDIAVVANLAHRVLVAYAGRLVEVGSCQDVLANPAHPYTKRLLGTVPVVFERRVLQPIPGQAPAPGARPSACFFAPRCPHVLPLCTTQEPSMVEVRPRHVARCVRARDLPVESVRSSITLAPPLHDGLEGLLTVRDLSTFYGERQVLFDASMTVRPRECLALVGESGSGKTTLARSIIGLVTSWRGEIRYKGEPLAKNARARPRSIRQELQYIFQSPYSSLNPRRTVGESIATPLQDLFGLRGRAASDRVERALSEVLLPLNYASRYPDQLSGGERQRVAIARALICDPQLLICDEITSALDVSVQASIVRLLERLQKEHGLAILFVTHNLALVRSIAHRVTVMNHGRVVETGDCADVLDNPREPYTRSLLMDTPTLSVGCS